MDFRINFCVLLLGLLQAQSWGCPDGWNAHNHSCYVLMKETYNWFDAKVACDVLDSKLVEIESAEENQYVVGLMQSHAVSDAWIGLEDLLEENVFVWVSTKQRPDRYFWGHNEPNNWQLNEDCTAIISHGKWYDIHCENYHVPLICEMPAPSEEIIG